LERGIVSLAFQALDLKKRSPEIEGIGGDARANTLNWDIKKIWSRCLSSALVPLQLDSSPLFPTSYWFASFNEIPYLPQRKELYLEK
jgi:hypothetical protein